MSLFSAAAKDWIAVKETAQNDRSGKLNKHENKFR